MIVRHLFLPSALGGLGFLLLSSTAASSETRYAFLHYEHGYRYQCVAEDFSKERLVNTIRFIGKPVRYSWNSFRDGGATIFKERVVWPNGSIYVAMATDDYSYCLRNWRHWAQVMQEDFDAHPARPNTSSGAPSEPR